MGAQREKPVLGIEREGGIDETAARLLVGEQAFGAFRHPFHRPADDFRCPERQRVFRQAAAAGPETAAHVVADHAKPGLGQVEDLRRQDRADAMRRLDGGADRVAFLVRIVVGEAAAGLHRVSGHPVDADAVAHDVSRPGEGRSYRRFVADPVGEGLVAGIVVPDRRRAGGQRVVRGDQRRQRRIIDLNQLGGVLGRIHGLGDDEGDRLAGHARAALGQQRLRRLEPRRAVGAAARHRRPHRAETARGEVVSGQDRQNSGRSERRLGVDRIDVRVRVGRAQDIGARLVGRVHVVEIAAPALDQPVILVPPDGVADTHHGHLRLPLPVRDRVLGPGRSIAHGVAGRAPSTLRPRRPGPVHRIRCGHSRGYAGLRGNAACAVWALTGTAAAGSIYDPNLDNRFICFI